MLQPPNDQPDWQHPQYYQQQPQYQQPNYPQQPSQPNWPPQQSGQLPPQYTQYPQYPQQPPYQHTGPGMPPPQWEQPYQRPGMPPQYPMPPQQPPRKAGRLPVWTILLVIAIVVCAVAGAFYGVGNSSNTSSIPNQPSVQSESTYKASTTFTTVDNLDKNGNVDKGKDVHFNCKILKFVKDNSGNTAGANVDAPDSYLTAIIQVGFPAGTDITQLNVGDIVEVWGTDAGVFSGQNAFGANVQGVEIGALYMTDKTTNYQTQ
jgi:hypothetical protein